MKKLEITAYVCLIALCLLAGGVILKRELFTSSMRPNTKAAERALLGKSISGTIPQDMQRKTVVIAISAKCPACIQSAAGIRQVVDAAVSPASGFDTVIVSPDNPESIRTVLDHQAVVPIQVPLDRIGVQFTPTVLVVQGGTIQKAMIGTLTKARQAELMEYVR